MSRHPHWRLGALAAAAAATFGSPAFAADFLWTDGAFVPGVTAPNPLPVGDTLTIASGATNKFFAGTSFDVAGTVLWLADPLYMGSSVINNAGLWDARSDDTFVYFSGSTPSFGNTGTFRKSGGSGATRIGAISFVNSGTVEAQTGRIEFDGGNASFLAGSAFVGAGRVAVTNHASFSGAFSSTNLSLQAGTFSGNAAVVNGAIDFSGGILAGGWTVGAGQSLAFAAGADKAVYSGTLVNQGLLAWQAGTGNLYLGSSTVDNQGVFDVQGSLTLVYATGSTPLFANSGIVQVAAGQTLTVGAVAFANSGGVLDAAAGASIDFAGGNATFHGGTQFTGAGVVAVSNNARFIDGFSAQNLELRSGAFHGGDGVTAGSQAQISGQVRFTGGALVGNWTLAPGQQLTMGAGGDKQIVSAALLNQGTMAWQAGTGNLYLGSSVVDNAGLFDVQGDLTLVYASGSTPLFTNSGTVQVGSGHALTVGAIAFVNQGGRLDAAAGATIDFSGGNARFNGGTQFTGAGVVAVSSNARFVDGFDAQNLELRGGAFHGGDGVTAGSQAVLNGQVRFTGGALVGNWTVAAGQQLTLGAGGDKQIVSAALLNQGTMAWQAGAGNLYLGSSAIDNPGLFDVHDDLTLVYASGSTPLFGNGGTVRVAAGRTLTVGAIAFVNNGGTLDAATGATIAFAGGNARFNAGTSFTGAGVNAVSSNARFVDAFTSQNLVLRGGSLLGGDGVTAGSRAVLNGSVAFTGGTLSQNWEIAAGQTLTGQAGGSKAVFGASLTNGGHLVWQTDEALHLGSTTITNDGRIDLQADAAWLYAAGSTPLLLNRGLLVKSAGAGTADLSTLTLVNTGTIDVQSGAIHLPANFGNDGTLTGSGTLTTNLLVNAGHVAPGAGPGALQIQGSFVQSASGFLDIELNSATVHDTLLVGGAVALDGTLALQCLADCHLDVGEQFVVLDYDGARSGSFAGLSLSGFASGGFEAIYDDANTRVLLRVTETVTAVPEPATWTLLAGGLALLAGRARRARA